MMAALGSAKTVGKSAGGPMQAQPVQDFSLHDGCGKGAGGAEIFGLE
jgi:hypothetical protein